ncbi:MAG: alpha/beta hydrolase [Spirochaetia bacterium]|jgi:alpha-beta hydrolase superfamily lysophospholipase|nr:alpha/beta hydrolase [Spirochaetia bacterium]
MKTEEFSFLSDDGKSIHVYHWIPESKAKACVLIAHGLGEHASRYARFATALTDEGYEVWAPDHRGHGKTAAEGELGWLADKDGFKRVVKDMHGLAKHIATERPGMKLFLFGHSWGSFLSQGYISLHGTELAGCILSGTAGDGGVVVKAGRLIAAVGCLIKGQKVRSPLMTDMSFGSYNKAFEPNRTTFDWLSRDNAEVDKYIADPLCGFQSTFGLFRDLLGGLAWIHSPATMAAVPKTLPLLMFAGAKDPVGAAPGTFDWLYERYRQLGIADLSKKLYPDARHETLNDTCREEVTADVISWIKERT